MTGGEKHTAVLTHMLASAHRALIKNLVKSTYIHPETWNLGKAKYNHQPRAHHFSREKREGEAGLRNEKFSQKKTVRYLQDHLQDSIFPTLTDTSVRTLSLGPHLISQ